MKRLYLFATLYCLVANLSAKEPSQILPKDRMVGILVDLELARAWVYQAEGADKEDKKALDTLFLTKSLSIYQQHDTDEATFIESYGYYLNHPPLMLAIYEQVVTQLEALLSQSAANP